MKIAWWIIVRIVVSSLAYFGLVEDQNGPRNVLMFWCWIYVIVGALMLINHVAQKTREEKRVVPPMVDFVFISILTSVLIWYGYWVTGIFMAIASALVYSVTGGKPAPPSTAGKSETQL